MFKPQVHSCIAKTMERDFPILYYLILYSFPLRTPNTIHGPTTPGSISMAHSAPSAPILAPLRLWLFSTIYTGKRNVLFSGLLQLRMALGYWGWPMRHGEKWKGLSFLINTEKWWEAPCPSLHFSRSSSPGHGPSAQRQPWWGPEDGRDPQGKRGGWKTPGFLISVSPGHLQLNVFLLLIQISFFHI